MALFLSSMPPILNFFEKYGDPRVASWPLMSNPLPALTIIATYIYFVKILGPRLMEYRKPFELKNILLLYNFFQVILSFYIFYEMSDWMTGEYNYRCQPVDYSHNPKAIRIMNASGIFLFAKLSELLETVFFVMRKKFNQVSVLHVFHHSSMILVAWFGFKFVPGGHITFSAFVNSFVHILMYSYYLLSALGPEVRKYLWWKRYLTKIQMIQFVICMIHIFQLPFIECDFPKSIALVIGVQVGVFYLLFKNFYEKEYSDKTHPSLD